MKRSLFVLALNLTLMLIAINASAQAEVAAAISGAVKKVIKAVDLKIQREQNKVIWLQNAQKTVENAMSKLKLTEISDWAEKQRKLYNDYFIELRKVKTAISTYQKVKSIIQLQLRLVDEYKRGWSLLKQDKHFNPRELEQMYLVYAGIINESLKNIDQLMLVTNSFATQMSDGKRLELIAMTNNNLEVNLMDIRKFTARNLGLSISRSKDQAELDMTKKIYGLK